MASTLNVFIAQNAYENIQWQKDVTIIKSKQDVEPGKLLGISSFAGYYSYKPISYDEMTSEQRKELFDHPKLKAWLQYYSGYTYPVSKIKSPTSKIVAVHQQLPEPIVLTPVEAKDNIAKYKYNVTTEDLCTDQILHIKLQEPEKTDIIKKFTKKAE
jgi:hypothetical protein